MSLEVSQLAIKVTSDGIADATQALQGLTVAAGEAEKKSVILKTATDGNTATQKSASDAAEKYLTKLQAQADSLGQNASFTAKYNAELKGLRDIEIAAAGAIGAKIDQRRAEISAMKEQEAAQQKLAEAQARSNALNLQGQRAAEIAALKEQTAAYTAMWKEAQKMNAAWEAGKALNSAGFRAEQLAALKAQAAAQEAVNKKIHEGAGALDKFGLGTVGAKREVMVLAHEMINGNFSRIPGSVLVLGERMSSLGNAIASVFTVTGLAVTAAIAAVGAFGYAMVKGEQEQRAMNNALLLTGGYAGMTSDGILQMARSVQGNVSVAKKAMTELAASGQFTASQVLLIGDAATKMHEQFGIEVDKTIQQFEELTKKPAEAILKLNDHYHFLTGAVYEQILALEKEGNTQEAARLSVEAYSKAIEDRAKTASENLGTIVKLWREIKDATQSAIDKALEWGKKATPQSNLDAAKAKLTYIRQHRRGDSAKAQAQEEAAALRVVAAAQEQVNRAALRAAEVGIQQRVVEASLHAASQLAIEDAKGKQKSALALALAKNAEYEASIKANDLITGEHSAAVTEEAIAERRAYTIKRHTAAAKGGEDDRLKNLEDALIKEKTLFDREKSSYDENIIVLDQYHAKLGLSDITFFATKAQLRTDYITAEKKTYDDEVATIEAFIAKNPREIAAKKEKEDALLRTHLEFLDKMHKVDVEDSIAREVIRHKLDEDEQKAADKTVEAINKQVEALQNKVEANSKLPSAIEAVRIAELQEQITFLQGSGFEDEAMQKKIRNIEAELEARKRLHSSELSKEQEEADTKSAKKYQAAYDSANKSISDGLYNAISEGGTKAGQKLIKDLKNWFARLVLNPIIQPISSFGASIMAGMSGGGNGIAGMVNNGAGLYNGLGNLGGFANNVGLGGAYNTAAGWFGATGAGITGGGSAVGAASSMGGSGLFAADAGYYGAAEAAGGGAAAAGGAAAEGVAGGLGSTLSTVAPIIGAAIVAKMFYDHFNGGETRAGGQYGYKFDGQDLFNNRRGALVSGATSGVNFLEGPSGGQIAGGQVNTLITSTVASINNLLKGAGSSNSLTGFQAALESSGEGRGGVFAGGKLSSGATFGSSGSGDNYSGTLFDRAFSTSPDSKTAMADFVTELQQTTVQALQAATDLPKSIRDELKSVDAKTLTDQTATALITSITAEITSVNQFRTAVDSLPFANLKNLSFDAANALIKLSGNLQTLETNINGYYNNFYSSAERISKVSQDVDAALSTLGYSGITTKAQFRAIVDSLDLTTNSGQKTYVQLMNLQGAFSQVADAATATATAAQAAATATANAAQAAVDAVNARTAANQSAVQQAVEAAHKAAIAAADNAFQALQRSVAAQKTLLQKQHDAQIKAIQDQATAAKLAAQEHQVMAQQALQDITTVFNSLKTAASALAPMTRGVAQDVLNAALTKANAGGSLANYPGLDEALKSVQQPSQQLFATFFDYEKDQKTTANTVIALRDHASTQVSVAQMTLDAIKASIVAIDTNAKEEILELDTAYQAEVDRLDNILSTAQKQLDALKGIDGSVLSVANALANFNTAVSKASTPVSTSDVVSQLYQNIQGRNPDTQGLNYWTNQINNGSMSTSQVAQQITNGKPIYDAVTSAYANFAGKTTGMIDESGLTYWTGRAYTVGVNQMMKEFQGSVNGIDGSHADGLDRVPFDGYRAELHKGERVLTAKQAADYDAVCAEIRDMKSDLNAALVVIAQNTGKTARLEARWDSDGIPFFRTVDNNGAKPVLNVHTV